MVDSYCFKKKNQKFDKKNNKMLFISYYFHRISYQVETLCCMFETFVGTKFNTNRIGKL